MTQQDARRLWDEYALDTAMRWTERHAHDTGGEPPPSDDYLRLAMEAVPDAVLEVMSPDEAFEQWRAAVLAYF